MVGLYIFGGLLIVGLMALMVFRTKWGRATKKEARGREENIENERIEELAKAAARAGK
jgi:hypothetical protein